MSEPVLQSALGTVNNFSGRAGKTWNDGSLNAGEANKMHHKRATVDCKVLGGPNEMRSREEQEGQNAPVLCSRYAGYDEELERPYGEFLPLQEKDRPIMVYAGNQKTKPVLVGVLHHTDDKLGEVNEHDILPTDYPIDPEDKKEALRQIWIHRCQDGYTIEGENGEFEMSVHSKTFAKSCKDEDEEKFDYEDLHLKDKKSIKDGDPKTIYLPEDKSDPLKYFAVFRNKYKDEDTDYLRFCVDASKVAFKWLQQKPNDDKLTYGELKEDGEIKVRRQVDAVERESGEKYAECLIQEDGTVAARRIGWTADTDIEIKEDGLYVDVDKEKTIGQFTKDHILFRIGTGEIAEIKMVDGMIKISVGGNAMIQMTKDEILAKVGGSTIDMQNAQITINSPMVYIN